MGGWFWICDIWSNERHFRSNSLSRTVIYWSLVILVFCVFRGLSYTVSSDFKTFYRPTYYKASCINIDGCG